MVLSLGDGVGGRKEGGIGAGRGGTNWSYGMDFSFAGAPGENKTMGGSNPYRSHEYIYLGGNLICVLGIGDGTGGEEGGGGRAEVHEFELRHGWLDR